jgi:hypothetical protein
MPDLSIQCAPQYTPKRRSSELYETTRQQVMAKIPVKRSAYHILGVVVLFVLIVFKV